MYESSQPGGSKPNPSLLAITSTAGHSNGYNISQSNRRTQVTRLLLLLSRVPAGGGYPDAGGGEHNPAQVHERWHRLPGEVEVGCAVFLAGGCIRQSPARGIDVTHTTLMPS